MSQSDDHNGGQRIDTADELLWRRSSLTESEDDAARLLDLAGFADARLADSDDVERIAAWLAEDPDAAADVAAARAIAGAPPAIASDAIVARAVALVGSPEAGAAPPPPDESTPDATVIPFARPPRPAPSLFQRATRWVSLAAALVIASWLGFSLGTAASFEPRPTAQAGDDSFFGELLDPATGVMRNLTDGLET